MKFFVFLILLASTPIFVLGDFDESRALNWLRTHQNPDGSFNAWFSPQTAFPAIALYRAEGNSSSAYNASVWVANDLNYYESYATWGEAGSAGVSLYSFGITESGLIRDTLSVLSEHLLLFQMPSGGFKGWWDYDGSPVQVENVPDTAWSLLGLLSLNSMSDSSKQSAVSYLKSLQNLDGSFNLTYRNSSHSLSSLAPDSISLTALSLWALKKAGASEDESVSRGLNFLQQAISSCFENNASVMGSALSAHAFNSWQKPSEASAAVNYLKNLQKNDGGFADYTRLDQATNPLDTGFAVLTIKEIPDNGSSCTSLSSPSPSPSPSPTQTPSPSPSPTPSPSLQPTVSPSPTVYPTNLPTPIPSNPPRYYRRPNNYNAIISPTPLAAALPEGFVPFVSSSSRPSPSSKTRILTSYSNPWLEVIFTESTTTFTFTLNQDFTVFIPLSYSNYESNLVSFNPVPTSVTPLEEGMLVTWSSVSASAHIQATVSKPLDTSIISSIALLPSQPQTGLPNSQTVLATVQTSNWLYAALAIFLLTSAILLFKQ